MKLRQAVEHYLSLKQSLGFRFATDRQILKAFSQAMGQVRVGQVKPTSLRAYLDGSGPVTRNWERKWVALRGFYVFALARGLVRRSPVPAWAPKVARTFTPMPLGIRMVFGEFFPRSGPGAFEFGDIFLEGSNGARFGGAPFAAFGQTGLGDPAQ